ncbi:unnamed protein product [Auanema sp. JU1783]|nr:unnamed protein product [Auanema sp. JU1783]
MYLSRLVRLPKKPFTELDYVRHMPKEYVERTKRTIPRKVFGGRFGAPDVKRWVIHPDDYEPTHQRPWEHDVIGKSLERENQYHSAKLSNKHFELRKSKISRIPEEQWTFFPGDLVQVMVGKDKGRQGTVLRVSRDTNEIFVEGMHCKLEEELKGVEKIGIDKVMSWKEQPLRVDKNQVKLVDPNDNDTCSAKWILNDSKSEYIRVSERSGFEIPIPSQAKVTYEYIQPDKYIEVENKDTPAAIVLERTYVPKLCSFEEEINETHGIKEQSQPQPTYWY